MFKKILIATDGSDIAENAADFGIKLAKNLNSEVYCIYVVDTTAFSSINNETLWQNLKSILEEEGKKALKNVENKVKNLNLRFYPVLKYGNPHEEIVKFAKDKGIDLIVMGTSGRSGLNRFLIGSVAEKVIRTAPCPVMVIRKGIDRGDVHEG